MKFWYELALRRFNYIDIVALFAFLELVQSHCLWWAFVTLFLGLALSIFLERTVRRHK